MRIFNLKAKTFLKRDETIAIIGSCQNTQQNKRYIKMAENLGKNLASEGYNVLTGGGPGIMEAANRGAHSINSDKSYSMGIFKWLESDKTEISQRLKNYQSNAERANEFSKKAKVFVAFPGSTGTVTEILIGADGIACKDEKHVELILLVGKKYFAPLMQLVKNMEKMKFLNDLSRIFKVVRNDKEALQAIRDLKKSDKKLGLIA